MSTTCYDPILDDRIIEIIENNNETRFNILVELLNQSPRTISRHLKFLANEQKILEWQKNPHGEKGSIKLTPDSELKRRYGILSIDYSHKRGICKEWKKNMKNKEISERKKKAILFLLLAVARGYTIYQVSNSLKPQLGDVPIKDSKGNLLSVSNEYTEKGFSSSDLDRQDFLLSDIYHILLLNRFTKKEMEDMIEELKKYKDIPFRPIIGHEKRLRYDLEDDERYDLEDDVLKKLLIWCCNILTFSIELMEQYWFILSKIPTSEERSWYHFIKGDQKATQFFTKIQDNRQNRRTIKDLYIELHHSNILNEDFKNLNKKIIDKNIEVKELHKPKFFTEKEMKKEIFTRSNEMIFLQDLCKIIASNKKLQELINSKKYEWILKELTNIINPDFSRSKYEVKLN